MTGLNWFLLAVVVMGALAYHRANRFIWTASLFVYLLALTLLHDNIVAITISWLLYAIIFIPLNVGFIRRQYLSAHLYRFYLKVMPAMSRTEREAISSGTITWEGDLFRGNPQWQKLFKMQAPKLTAEEQAFLDGPVEKLCTMLDDWQITHQHADLPEVVWQFLKDNGFFSLIIPKQYGGKAFSAYAHSQILVKISGRSVTASSIVAVPNSLGPAELLLHYGTEEQKNHYLPRLAKGLDVPCFALTSPEAGSDAGAMTDYGIVTWGEHEGQTTLGIKLNFNKRYITLAPVATVVGLAFKLYDPEGLLGREEDIGITCALIPRQTPGITIGRRHFPLNAPFQNGPIQGKDVFIPMSYIIGGAERAGQGWRMLMECLAAGRAISLPASALGGAKVLAYAGGAYARIRQQFNVPVGRFEGVEEPLARIAALTYLMDAVRSFASAAIDAGEKPAVASAIVKYHVTELGRRVACDGMDVHGGKGICLGPKNYLGRSYEASPIAITVEGANILTRCMIIFGQGVIRCHPYVLAEMEAARIEDKQLALKAFDKAVMKHIAFGLSNTVRTLFLGFTGSWLVMRPGSRHARLLQHMTRFSSALAFVSDVAMMSMGGNLKRKESISARLGDVLSYLYLLSAVLKHHQDQGTPKEDDVIVQYLGEYCLFQIQQSFDGICRNFPNRALGAMLRMFVFPLGMHFKMPHDHANHLLADLIIYPSDARLRLAKGAYLSPENNVLADVQDALIKSIAAEPIEKAIKSAKQTKKVVGYTLMQQAQDALKQKLISLEQFDIFMQAEEARKKVIAVDDFNSDDLMHGRPVKVGAQHAASEQSSS